MLTTGVGSLTTGSSDLASVAGASVSAAGSAGFSAAFSVLGELLLLRVPRSLANGDFGFSPSSSLVVAFSFLLFNHGRELLRLSLLTAGGAVSVFDSPLTTGVVSTGTVAGLATLVAKGSVDSTAGMTGAVSLTG